MPMASQDEASSSEPVKLSSSDSNGIFSTVSILKTTKSMVRTQGGVDLSVLDRLTLNDVEKYQKHGIFPTKMCLHILLLGLLILQMFEWFEPANVGARGRYETFFCENLLEMKDDCMNLPYYEGVDPVQYIGTEADFLDSLRKSVDVLYDLQTEGHDLNTMFVGSVLEANQSSGGMGVTMLYKRISDEQFAGKEASYIPGMETKEYNSVRPSMLGPFDASQLGNVTVSKNVARLVTMELRMTFEVFSYTSHGRECLRFQLRDLYDYGNRAMIERTTKVEPLGDCSTDKHNTHQLQSEMSMGVSIGIIVLCCVRIILSVRSVCKRLAGIRSLGGDVNDWMRYTSSVCNVYSPDNSSQYRVGRSMETIADHKLSSRLTRWNSHDPNLAGSLFPKQDNGISPEEASFSCREYFYLINVYFLILVVGDTCIIISNAVGLIEGQSYQTSGLDVYLNGFGNTCVWMNVMRYIEHLQTFKVMIRVFRKAVPRAAFFLLGALPIFIGFVVFGTLQFSTYSRRFRDLPTTAITLFCTMNADEMIGTFTDVDRNHEVLGPLFITGFSVVYIYVFLNVFLVIIAHTYEELYMKRQQFIQGEGTSGETQPRSNTNTIRAHNDRENRTAVPADTSDRDIFGDELNSTLRKVKRKSVIEFNMRPRNDKMSGSPYTTK